MKDSEINLFDLNQTGHGTNFSANDRAEQLVTTVFCTAYNIQDNGGTNGYAPEYDRIYNDTQVEIKMSKNKDLFIELFKADGTESGLLVTTSEIHMFINFASTKIDGEWVDMMKVRLIKTAELRAWVEYMAEHYEDKLVVFDPSDLGKGSAGFFLNLKTHPGPEVNDLFVMAFEYRKNASGHIIMDTEKIIMPQNRFAAININNYIKLPQKKVDL